MQDIVLRLIGEVAMESAVREGSFMGGRVGGFRPGWQGRRAEIADLKWWQPLIHSASQACFLELL